MHKFILSNLAPGTLKLDPEHRLSFPRPGEDRAGFLAGRFPGIPHVIVNNNLQVVFGECVCRQALEKGLRKLSVVQGDIPQPASLFLGFNLMQSLFNVNLYEKVHFASLALVDSSIPNIREATEIDLPLNPELIERLPLLIQSDFKPLLRDGRISLKTALELCEMAPEDRPPLFALFSEYHFTASQGLRFVEMVREVMNRDDCPAIHVLQNCILPPHAQQDRPGQFFLSTMEALRFPLARQEEKKWQSEMAQLGLPPEIRVTHAPFFEKKAVEVHWKVADMESLHHLLRQIQRGLGKG